jgi:anti-anti-sigma factor
MNTTTEKMGQAAVFHCAGDLNVDSLEAFRHVLDHALEDRQVRDAVLDFHGVPFVDSAGWECLLDLQERLAERLGQVKLVGVDENVAKILEITRLAEAFDCYGDLATAVKVR